MPFLALEQAPQKGETVEIILTILLAGATPPDVRHPDAGLQPSIEVCEAKRDKARAQGHLAECIVFDPRKPLRRARREGKL